MSLPTQVEGIGYAPAANRPRSCASWN